MKYIHDYKDGSFCESTTFEAKVGQPDYLAISDEDYQALCEGSKKLENGEIVVNEDFDETRRQTLKNLLHREE